MGGIVTSASVSAEGVMALTSGGDGTLRLFDCETGACEKTIEVKDALTGKPAWISSAAFSPSPGTVAASCKDGTARLFSLDGECVRIFQGHRDSVLSVAFSLDGELLLTASKDCCVKVFDLG